MSTAAPRALPENHGLAFRGERIPVAARLTPSAAEKLLAARNPNGRPNTDVVRCCVTWSGGRLQGHWLVDFPPDMDAQEAALYVEPARLAARIPERNRALRTALARRERYLAMPATGTPAQLAWVDSSLLPDDSLLVVARDDDFAHGLFTSGLFAYWWREFHAPREPQLAFDSFPWPWAPTTLLSGLTRQQEEYRLAVARAARAGDADRLDAAVISAYGWPAGLPDEELLERLVRLHSGRTG